MTAPTVNLHTMTCQISIKFLLKFFCLPTHTQESKFIFPIIATVITHLNHNCSKRIKYVIIAETQKSLVLITSRFSCCMLLLDYLIVKDRNPSINFKWFICVYDCIIRLSKSMHIKLPANGCKTCLEKLQKSCQPACSAWTQNGLL